MRRHESTAHRRGLPRRRPGGCSDGGSTKPLTDSTSETECAKRFAAGVETTDALFDTPCTADGEERTAQLPTEVVCKGEKIILTTDDGWGYKGQAWHVHESAAHAELAAEAARCGAE